jgi:hypothetical protein
MDKSILENYPECNKLLEAAYTSSLKKETFFTYAAKIPDVDFLDNLNDNPAAKVYNPLEWYKSFNPEFKPLALVNPELEVYKPLLQQFIKDLYILMTTKQFPLLTKKDKDYIQECRVREYQSAMEYKDKPEMFYAYFRAHDYRKLFQPGRTTFYNTPPNDNKNTIPFMYNPKIGVRDFSNKEKYRKIDFTFNEKTKENCEFLLDKINKTIVRNYLYLDVIECFKIYLEFMSFADILNKDKKTKTKHFCTPELDLINELEQTPFLIYPSSMQPNYYKTLLLMGAPIINVLSMNKISVVHYEFQRPCIQVYHDILVHGEITHQYHKYQIVIADEAKQIEEAKKIEKLFTFNTKILTELLPSLKYDFKNPITTETSKEQFKKIIILFMLLHEEFLTSRIRSGTNFNNIANIVNFLFNEGKIEYDRLIKNLQAQFNEEYKKYNKTDNVDIDEIIQLLIEIKSKITEVQPASQASQASQAGGAKNNYRRKLSRKHKLTKMKKAIKTKSRK